MELSIILDKAMMYDITQKRPTSEFAKIFYRTSFSSDFRDRGHMFICSYVSNTAFRVNGDLLTSYEIER